MNTEDFIPAKRGNLVVIEDVTAIYYQNGGTEFNRRVEIGRIVSVTREGDVKRAEIPEWGNGNGRTWRADRDRKTSTRLYLVPPDKFDADATLRAYAARRYPGNPHSDMVQPCESLDEMRSLLVRRQST